MSEGCIGVAISNAPPNMAPFGGKTRFLGTNPVAIGIPAGEEDPLIFDASTSVVARGKIIVAAHTKTPIPEGWAIDPEGYPTTDAEQALAGAVLPFGGPKGSAISFIIDVLCGVLTGASFASAPEHARGSRDRTERRTRASPRSEPICSFSDSAVQEADGCHPENAEERRLRRPGTERVLVPGEIELAPTNHEFGSTGIALARGDRRAAGRAWRGARRARFRLLGGRPFFGVCSIMNARRRTDFQFPADSDRRALRVRSRPARCRTTCDRSAAAGVRRDRPRRARFGDRRHGHRRARSGGDRVRASTTRSRRTRARR